MRLTFLFLLSGFLSSISCVGQKSKTDTVFIFRENKTYYHAVFIEKNKKSHYYNDLIMKKNSPWDSSLYKENVSLLKEKTGVLQQNKIKTINKNWYPLYLYKGNYFVYYPSDGAYNGWISINDSIFLNYAAGEMIPEAITKVNRESSALFRIATIKLSGDVGAIYFHLIDKEKGIAVFEFVDEAPPNRYRLMIDSRKIKKIPLIINYCQEQKQEEFEFDKPDYEKIIGIKNR